MKHSIRSYFLFILFFVLSDHIIAQNFHLVKDINTSTDGNPSNFNNNSKYSMVQRNKTAVLNGVNYFGADDGVHGVGLWRSDGTTTGTYQVKEAIHPTSIIVLNGKLLFIAVNHVVSNNYVALWTSDGTAAGTVPVLNDPPPGLFTFIPEGLTNLNGTAFFSLQFPQTQLWKTDGTANGTILVKDFAKQTEAFSIMTNFVAIKNKIYFTAMSRVNFVTRLWVSDGSPAGTQLISSAIAEPGQIIAGSPSNSDSTVYFTGAVSQGGNRLIYVTNGTPGNVAIAAGFNGQVANNYNTTDLINIGGVIYFAGRLNTGTSAQSLYKFNIAAASGIEPVKIVVGSSNTGTSSEVQKIREVDGKLFFNIYDAPNNKYQLWKSNGDSSGNVLLKDSLNCLNSVNANGVLYFNGVDSAGEELWKSDGTINGTVLIKDINPGGKSSNPLPLNYYNNQVLFSATDGSHGIELWQSDGTTTGTVMVKDINKVKTSSSLPAGLTAFNNKVLFTAYDEKENPSQKLWISDGTSNGTTVVVDTVYRYAPASTSVDNLIDENYFWGNSLTYKQGLYKTNGTAAGTILVRDFTDLAIKFYGIKATNNLIYFFIQNTSTGTFELWRTDGTGANTYIVKNDIINLDQTKFVATGNVLLFVSPNSGGLWKTDGTIAGTTMVKSFATDPKNLTVLNAHLFFTASDGNKERLWKSDGSSAGTFMVTDKASTPADLISCNNELFFSGIADVGTYGNLGTVLFKTDGTNNGTMLVKDIYPGLNANLYNPISLNGVVYFFTKGQSIIELWKTDGTSTGTSLVSNINNQAGRVQNVVSCNGRLFFIIRLTLWESDGTQTGTFQVLDSNFLSAQFQLNDSWSYLTPVGNQLFFNALNYQYGIELYVGDIAPVTYHSVGHGNWNDPSIWRGNTIPPPGANIIITHNIIGNINVTCNSLTVNSPGSLMINTGINIIVLR